MKRRIESKGISGWMMGIMAIGAALMLLACDQPSGQSGSLANKPPPSLGAIANVDGSDETKKDEKKTPAGAEQKPAQGQPAQPAPKQ
jgi:hypothetical protein